MLSRPVQVLRPFKGERLYKIGEVVDAAGWRTYRQLIADRRITPFVEAAPEQKSRKQRGG